MRARYALLAVIAIAFVVAGCGGSGRLPIASSGSSAAPSGSSAAPSGRRAVNGGVAIVVPSGWEAGSLDQPAGLVLAADKADLGAAVPKGPRLKATRVDTADPSPSDLVAAIDQASLTGPVETADTTIGGKPAASVEFTQTVEGIAETTRTVAVSTGPGAAYLFTLEAPEAKWQSNLSTLEAALASTTFDG